MDSLLATPRQSFATQSTTTLVSTPRPSTASTLVGPNRPSLAITHTNSNESKRFARSKESQFQVKYGHKHHTYDAEKAPYPVSYDRHVLEL